jgi:hypothetical protein
VLQAAGHAHQPGDIERHEGEMEADEPAPERGLPQRSSSLKPKALGTSNCSRQSARTDARDDDVMEMREPEDAVVHLPIDSRQGQAELRSGRRRRTSP